MDSRIREIEQWIAEAKQDLGECGREAYINKLYLLDAEIRAIIKEDGSLPAANSPRQQVINVRRRSLPRAAIAAAVGVLIVAASTVYFTLAPVSIGLLAIDGTPEAGQTGVTDNASPHVISAAYIPRLIPGEEILPNDWRPPIESVAPGTAQPAAGESAMLAAAVPSGKDAPVTAPDEPNLPVIESTPAMEQATRPVNEATVIALTPGNQPVASAPAESEAPVTNPVTTAVGGEVERTIATEVPTENPEDLNAGDDRGFHEPWHVDNGDKSIDKSIEKLADEIESGKLALNSTELAKIFREGLDEKED